MSHDNSDFIHLFHEVASSKRRPTQHFLRSIFWSHRLSLVICVIFVYAYYFVTRREFSQLSNSSEFLLGLIVAANLYYGIAVRLPRTFRLGVLWSGPHSVYIRFLLDVFFISAYFVSELLILRTDAGFFQFFYVAPLLMMGYYASLGAGIACALGVTALESVLCFAFGQAVLSPHSVVAGAMNFGAILLMDIVTGPYRSAISRIEKEMAIVYDKFLGFALAELDERGKHPFLRTPILSA